MSISNKKEAFFLFLGDIFFFFLSLYLALLIRGSAISVALIQLHFAPFIILVSLWILVFYIAGLYDKHTLILKSRLPVVIFNSQVANSAVAVLFFYLFPGFGITPKTILAIYLIVSFILISLWRIYGGELLVEGDREAAMLIGSGNELRELFDRVNNENRYTIKFVSSIDTEDIEGIDIQEDVIRKVYAENIRFIAIDFSNEKVKPLLPHLYNLIFSKVRFIDSHKIYEDVFDRIPLSLVTYSWFLENISVSPKFTYDFLKRVMDILLSLAAGLVSLLLYPFVFLAITLDDGGSIFISQDRIGKDNHFIKIYKFRSMQKNLSGDQAFQDQNQQVTRVGKFMRKTRIDELPQLWNVLSGDLSLIGPRPELPSGVKHYEEEIPFYNVRHLIKPGLSGWAQLYHDNHPHHGFGVEETKEKLSYDLFYIKNRSFLLDLKIALKTVRVMLSRSGI